MTAPGGATSFPQAHQSFSEYREAQVAASLPMACGAVLAVSFFYALVQYLFQPVQYHAALIPNAVQVSVPIIAYGLTRTRMRKHAEAIALSAELIYTLALCCRLFIPESSTSGTALFIAVKLLLTALFFPWSARVQYLSATMTLALYLICFTLAGRINHMSRGLHQLLGPAVAAMLSAAGAARGDRLRRELFRYDAEREELLARLQMILDRMPIGCIINDADFRYTYWNPAAEEIFGYSLDEVRGRHPIEVLTPPGHRDVAGEVLRRLAEGEIRGSGRSENRTKDGRMIICEWRSTPLRRRDGRFLGVLSMCQDVTVHQRDEEERTILLEELRAANRLKSDFLATMSHELRTPLNIMLGYNDLMLEGAFGAVESEQTTVLHRVGHSGRELLELVNAMLDLSRLEAGSVTVLKRPVDLLDLVAQVDAETREAQRKPNVRVEWRIGAGLPPVQTDPVKFKMVLKNLLTNAVKFTEEGSVVVSAARSDSGVEVRVSDTGIGISAEWLPIIFEPFRQVDSSATRRHGGVGIGLYIVRRLVDTLGSTIAVESELGRGTTFRVWVESAAGRPGSL